MRLWKETQIKRHSAHYTINPNCTFTMVEETTSTGEINMCHLGGQFYQ